MFKFLLINRPLQEKRVGERATIQSLLLNNNGRKWYNGRESTINRCQMAASVPVKS
jgi:hypothetical protein